MHWPTAFKYVPYDPKVRGFPMDYEPDQCSKVHNRTIQPLGTRTCSVLSPLLRCTYSFSFLFPSAVPAFLLFAKVTGVLWKDYTGPWPPPHLDMGVTIHETWNAMVDCYKAGLVRNIGVCNFKVRSCGKVTIA